MSRVRSKVRFSVRPMTLVTVFLAVLLTGCSGIYFNTTFNAEKAHRQALDMRAKRLRLNPDDTVSVTADEKAKLTRAITKSSKVLELWPNDPKYAPRAVFRIAECQLLLGDYGSAAFKYGEYLRYFPKGEKVPLARVRMAQALYLDGKPLAARDALAEVQASNPQGEVKREALLLAARMRIDDRSGAEGLELYEELLKDDALLASESRGELHWRAAQLAFDLGQWQKAREHALAADNAALPSRVRFRNHRLAVLSLYGLGRQKEGLAEVEDLWDRREYRVFRPEIKLLEARGFESRGDWPGAARLYRETVRLGDRRPSAAEAWYRIGAHTLDVANREDSARVYFDSAAAAGSSFEYGALAAEFADALKRLAELRAIDSVTLAAQAAARLAVSADSAGGADSLAGLDSAARAERLAAVRADSLAKVKKDGKKAKTEDAKAAAPRVEKAPSPQYAPFLIAELFHFRIPKPDSAHLFLNRIVADTLEDSVYTRRAIYALAWLEEERYHNKTRADSLYRVLLARYPATEWAKQAEKNLGLPSTVLTTDDRAHLQFLEAERRRLAGEDLKARVWPAYQAVADSFPQSRDAAKALFVIAFTSEQSALAKSDTSRVDAVRDAYAVVRDKFPGTPQAIAAESWINAVEAARGNAGTGGSRTETSPSDSADEEESADEGDGAPKVELLDPAAEQDLY